MSDNTQHIKQYSAADIRRYLQGQMTADEMHALEKAALDDPFLADAIEGMEQTLQQHDSGVMATHLQELNQQLQQRIAPSQAKEKAAPVITMRWWQAAAAAVVLIAGSIFVYNSVTNNDKPDQTLAVTETQTATTKETKDSITPPAPSAADAATQQATATTTSPLLDQQDVAVAKERKPAEVLSRRAKQTPEPAKTIVAPEYETRNADTTLNKVFTFTVPEKNDGVARDKNQAALGNVTRNIPINNAAKKQSDDIVTEVVKVGETNVKKGLQNQTTVPDKDLSNVIRGRVTDPFNNPLANAQLSTRHDSNVSNYLTDRNGDFRIPTADSTLDVAITAKGFESRNLKLQQNLTANQVQLQPATSNNQEGAANNFRNQARAAQTNSQNKVPTILVQDAQPVYGWVAYEQYLEKNKRVAETAVNTRGEVVVSFAVSRKGNLSDFKIEQSVSKELDEEAVRLIKVGPSWSVLKGRKARAMVIVKF